MSRSLSGLISSMNCLSSALAAEPITAASAVHSSRFLTRVLTWNPSVLILSVTARPCSSFASRSSERSYVTF